MLSQVALATVRPLTHNCCLAAHAVRQRQSLVLARCLRTSSLSSDDRLNIIELCHKFDRAINQHDLAAVAPMFTKAALLKTPKGHINGVDDIVAYFQTVIPMAKGNRHLTCDIIVEPDGEASAKAYSYRLLHRASAPPALIATGIIEDRLVMDNGAWKFAERHFVMDPPMATGAGQAPKIDGHGLRETMGM